MATRLTEALEKPELDNRTYRVIRLPNCLEALLVHDPDTDKASAAVDVGVGSFSDPESVQGLAHCLEHALFMGTEKYPKENAYGQYLASHSGYANAYTASTHTNYFFEVAALAQPKASSLSVTSSVAPSAASNAASTNGTVTPVSDTPSSTPSVVPENESPLLGALDRFAQFFICPLFLKDTLDRELRAVDSENKKNLQSDPWRLMQLAKSLANPAHPYHHFSTGNLNTLRDWPKQRGIEIRDAFIDFHAHQYSANRMKLVVLGREPLDALQNWVVDLFSAVKNQDLPPNRWDDVTAFPPDRLGKIIYAKPVMDSRTLELSFAYQDEDHLFEYQPSHYLSHLIGHEGPGSILAYLKARGWANSLSAGSYTPCPDTAFFSVSIRLTEDGLQRYHDVIKVVFEYIALLRQTPPQKWIYEETKNLLAVDFRWKQKSPASRFTSTVSHVMQKPLPREWLLSGWSLLRAYDPALITKALSYLRADNFNLQIVSLTYPGDWDRREKWYGTEYKLEDIPKSFLHELDEILEKPERRVPELHLPHRNEFVPTRFEVEKKEVEIPAQMPSLIRHDDRVRTWFKKDDTFWVPKGSVELVLRSPLVSATPGNNVMARLYCELVRDALNEYSYDAELAGLDYGITPSSIGLEVSIDGYNDKLPLLLEKVLCTMKQLEIKPDRFKIIKERMARGFRNAEYYQPYLQVSRFSRLLTADRVWVNEQFAAELAHIEPEDVAAFVPRVLRQVHIENLVHGNFYKEDALRITDMIEKTISARVLPQSQWHIQRDVILPRGSNYIYQHTLSDPANVNHCIEYYLFVDSVNDRLARAKTQLFSQMTHEPAFDQLRTREQLGYVVFSGNRYSNATVGYRVIVQSERDCSYLESRIDSFLLNFAQVLEEMSDADFETHKRSLINRHLEKLKNLGAEINRFWIHIQSGYFDFLEHEYDAETVRALTKAEMIEFYRFFIDPRSPNTRAKLSVHLNAQSRAGPSDEETAELKIKLVDGIVAVLNTNNVHVDAVAFKEQLGKLDTTGPHDIKDNVLVATRIFLEGPAKVDRGVVEKLQAPIKESVEKTLKADESSSSMTVDDGFTARPPTYVTNVPEFKARLPATTAPCPVVDLSEFEDVEYKL